LLTVNNLNTFCVSSKNLKIKLYKVLCLPATAPREQTVRHKILK
jgi:hypothetical protein